jgi:hypothetical protein
MVDYKDECDQDSRFFLFDVFDFAGTVSPQVCRTVDAVVLAMPGTTVHKAVSAPCHVPLAIGATATRPSLAPLADTAALLCWAVIPAPAPAVQGTIAWPVREVFVIHVGGTRSVTSSTDNIMKIHVRITLTVECIRTCLCLFLLYV